MLTFKYLIQNNFTITYITYFVLICLVVLVETSILINLKLDNKVNFFKYQVKQKHFTYFIFNKICKSCLLKIV